MKILSKPRIMGKTTQSIYESHKTGFPIVCTFKNDIKNIKMLAEKLNIDIPEPIWFNEVKEKMEGYTYKNIIIDDLDKLISHLTYSNLHAITLTGPEGNINWDERK